ncbi:unnamed protein product [Arabidopsis arenosa]|uniref:Uncharacterized protein n=1 Tax=Arabidopsis arenosa TaxID=38785 RepID=A0A8S2AC28_ARAAE|nr:unnamed protein product [Arabidopsis arenosa]
MSVVLNAGFTSPLRNRSHPVIALKTLPVASHISLNSSRRSLLSKRRLVVSCLDTNDNSVTTTSVDSSDSNKPASESVELGNGAAKRAPLTARERLKAARVLSRYTEATPKPSKPKWEANFLMCSRKVIRNQRGNRVYPKHQPTCLMIAGEGCQRVALRLIYREAQISSSLHSPLCS